MEQQDFELSYGTCKALLRRFLYLPTVEQPDLNSARLYVEVLETTDQLPLELFLWERQTYFNGDKQVFKDRAIAVCAVGDLSIFPANEPMVVQKFKIPPFYRLSKIDFVFESPDDLLRTWADIQGQLSVTIRTFVQLGLSKPYGS